MSSHPEIERFSESVKSSINKFLGIFDTKVQGSFRQGLAKAAIWTIGALVAVALPIAIIQQLQPGNHWLENASRLALAIVVSAFGQNLNLLGIAESGSTIISISAHPTLLTALVALCAFRAGRAFTKKAGDDVDSGRNHRFAVGLGLGSTAALLGATWILQGTFGWGTPFASLTVSSAFDSVVSFVIVAFAAWMGTKFWAHSSSKPSALAWARRATLNFVIIYSVILAVGAAVWLIYNLIAPHFMASQPITKSEFNVDLGQLALALVVILAFLPNFLLMFFSAGSGMTIGLNGQGAQALEALLAGLQPFIPGGIPTSFSINSDYGMILASIVLAVVSVVAMIAGAAATKKTDFRPVSGVSYIQALFMVIVIGIFATYLGNIGGSWSTPAVGTIPTISGNISFGIVLASLSLVITFVVTFAWLAAAKLGAGVENAFPKLVNGLSGTRSVERNQSGWLLFGRISSLALVTGLIVYPVTSATVSRVWASNDTPTLIGEKLSAKILSDDLDAIKKLIGPSVKEEQWLANEALKLALPTSADELKIAVKNNQTLDWVPGNTDATVNVSWKRAANVASWIIPTSSVVKNHYLLVNHPEFQAEPEPMFLDIQVNSFISKKNAAELKVNGVSVKSGSYAVVPGFYKITLPGQDLISPTEVVVATDGFETAYIAGNQAEIPIGGDEKLKTALASKEKKCGTLSDKGVASCFNAKDVTDNVVSQDLETPNAYFDATTADFKQKSLKCEADTNDVLLSAKAVARKQTCKVEATFTKTFYKTAKSTRQVTVSTYDPSGCEEYDDFYEEWYTYGCYVDSYEQQTIDVRGAKISKVTYSSEFEVTLVARGTLAKGKFSVK
jgi:hypothetical protein